LIHSSCLTRSFWLREACPIISCFINPSFSIVLRCCLSFHELYSLSRSDHVANNNFHVWRIKLSFHQVFVYPQRTPNEWVMPILLQCCNLSKDFRLRSTQCFRHISLYWSSNSSTSEVLESTLGGASDFQLSPSSTYLIRC
jgi:hypothetical protein